MILSLIVAVAENNVIGRGGDLPWRLSADLARFKQLTMGHALVMGRKTYESIGRPLPGRVSIVLTRQANFDVGDGQVITAKSLDEAIALVPNTTMNPSELFVIGGAEIYRETIPRADRLYRTLVHAKPQGDALLPEIDWSEWRLVESTGYPADERNEYAVTWEKLERVSNAD
ncbi:MAG: dihydrofolate reductase [Aeoliella sp.]